MAKSLKTLPFVSLLPDSISQDDSVAAAAAALDGVLQETGEAIGKLSLWGRIEEIEEPLLSLLAWQLHVDLWDPGWSLAQKRQAVSQSLAWHRRKGTPVAVTESVELAVGGETDVIEWSSYAGDPYRFKVTTTNSLDESGTMMDSIVGVVNDAKNTRSWLDGLVVTRQVTGHEYVGGVCRLAAKCRLLAFVEREFAGAMYSGGVMQSAVKLTLEE